MYKNVPFGISIFQIQNFTAGKESPYRRYRHCLLQLHQKTITLKGSQFNRERLDIDIEEINEKLKTAVGFERRRLEVDLKEKQFNLDGEVKLIEDCLIEVAAYEAILNNLPKFTREEFEQAEQGYWEKRLLNDAKREVISSGTITPATIKSLENIGFILGRNEKNQIVCSRGDDVSPKKIVE